jgi:hypothetical protein
MVLIAEVTIIAPNKPKTAHLFFIMLTIPVMLISHCNATGTAK